jgi:hypothetical protein
VSVIVTLWDPADTFGSASCLFDSISDPIAYFEIFTRTCSSHPQSKSESRQSSFISLSDGFRSAYLHS